MPRAHSGITTSVLPPRITLSELAHDFCVRPDTVRLWIRQGKLPRPRRLGGVQFWLLSDLDVLFATRESG